jgi:hypothetical protein
VKAERLTTAQMLDRLGLKTDRGLVDARAVRTPDGCWWLACRGFGLRDSDAPAGWIAPLGPTLGGRDDAADLEAEPGRRKVGRGWALNWAAD